MLSFRRAVSALVVAFGVLLSLSAGTVKAQVISQYSGTLTNASATFDRPEDVTTEGAPPTELYGDSNFKYQAQIVTISNPGTYTVASATDFDGYIILYQGSFDPNNPLQNALDADDDFGNLRRSSFDITLQPGTYILVTTSFSPTLVYSETVGKFHNRVYVRGTPTPRFARPNVGTPPTTVASATGTAGSVYYEIVDIASQVTQSGLYAITVTSNNPLLLDNFSILYNGAFNPAAPLTNVLASNDTFGTGTTNSGFKINLTAGQPYKVVVTGSTNVDFDPGNYVVTVTRLPDPPATQFQRPNVGYPPASLATATNYPYYVTPWTPTTSGFYKIKTVATNPGLFNTFTVLYQTSVNVGDPLTNAIVANDTFANEGGASGFYFSATAGQTYQIVVTGSGTLDYGAYTNEITLVAPLKNSFMDTTVGAPAITDRPNAGIPPTTQNTADPPHKAYTMTVSANGDYTLHLIRDNSVNTDYDTFLILYNGAFNPADSLVNVYAANDDFDTMTGFNRSALLNLPMATGIEYTVVVTGFGTTDEGGFKLEAFGPGNVRIARPVAISGTVSTGIPFRTLPITFRLRPVGGTSGDDIVQNVAITTDADGNAPFELRNVPSGNYNIGVKGELTLQTVVSNVDASNDVSGVVVTLRSGDSNADTHRRL
jgi:hypothetical protein